MFRFVVVVACVFASAQAGLVGLSAGSIATGPALGAPLLGRVTYNAPETTIVKQQVVVDQPEIRVRSVPTIVQTAPIVKTIQPVVHAAPQLTYSAIPAVQTVAAAPALTYSAGYPAIQTIGAPAYLNSGIIGSPAYLNSGLIGAPGLLNAGLIGAPGYTLNSGLIGTQQILLKK